MGARLKDLRRIIETASEVSVVKTALTDAAGLDLKAWGPNEWSDWLSFLLEVVMPSWLSCFVTAERQALFHAFFVRCPALDALTVLHSYLSREGISVEDVPPLIEALILRVPVLITLSASSSSSMWQLTLTSLFSLPERLANRTKRVPRSLHPTLYADAVVLQALTLCGADTPVSILVLIAALLGYASRLGHSACVAKHLLALAPATSSGLCVHLPESCLPSLLGAVLQQSPSGATLTALVGPLIRHSALALHLLSHKFLVTRTFPRPAPGSLIELVSFVGKRAQVLQRLALLWAEAAFLRQPISLQTYVSDALEVLLKGGNKEDADACMAVLLQGVQRRLCSALGAVRTQGMLVAERLSMITTPDAPLRFDELHKDEAHSTDVPMSEKPPDEPKEVQPAPPPKKCRPVDLPDDPDRLVLNDDELDAVHNEEKQSADDDDDLRPYDLRDDGKLGGTERPTYVRELLSVLTSASTPDNNDSAQTRMEEAMKVAPELIRSSVHELPSVAESLVSALLQVPDASRSGALQALLVSHPPCAAILSRRLYEPNYALTTRGAMMDALIDAAHELSALPKSDALPRDPTPSSSNSKNNSNTGEAEENSPLRIVGTTVRKFTRPKAVLTHVNRFERLAMEFFFQPLLARAHTALQALQALNDDFSLVARLAYTAGTFVLCAGPACVQMPLMCATLLEFLWSLRFLPSVQLKRALLISVWHVFSTLPASIPSYSELADHWRTYLESVLHEEADDECRLLAHYNLSMIQSALQNSQSHSHNK